MTFGKVYGFLGNPRTNSLLVIAKLNGLDVELVKTEPAEGVSAEYKAQLNPLGKIPSFESTDGFKLTEVIAIAIYLAAQNEKTTLLGKTKQDYASILKWMSFTNSELLRDLGAWFRPLVGRDPYNKKSVDTAEAATHADIAVLEKHLLANTYLVGERLSVADVFATSIVGRGMQFVFDKAFRQKYPAVTRWYTLIRNQPQYLEVAGPVEFIEEAVKYTPPKKEKKEAPKAAPKAAPKPKEVDEEDEPAVKEPQAKHPLEALGKPTLILDDWKRKYSNEDTPVAMKWFWENYKPEEYSLWKVEYKYNDELTLTFMSSNLIGGFFARLEASRKYLFGSMSVYGVSNDSIITGAFMVRGQEALPAFEVGPDYESYSFEKLDPSKPEDKALVESAWSWDKPVIREGKEYPHADGKVFK